jgi:hypothetical protein
MAPAELVESKVQLQELLDKGFICPSNSSSGAPVLFPLEAPRGHGERTNGRVYHMTQEEVRIDLEVVAGMLQLNSLYALIDLEATHLFISVRVEKN